MGTKKNPVGRPLQYKSAAELQKAIDKYFVNCEGIEAVDHNGDPILYKGVPVWKKKPEPYTITGLALAIGFNSRQSLLNYQEKDEFMDTLVRAKSKVELYAESRLYDKEGSNGAKFNLANNYKGWKDKQEIEMNANINVESYLKDCEGDSEF